MAVHLLGIRHHGPGSARNVAGYLNHLKPDMILVEGPPEAEALLKWTTHQEMKPPVALLAYNTENPSQAVFYPFAEFSAEWQAIKYGTTHQIPVRFFDIPLAHAFAIDNKNKAAESETESKIEAPIQAESFTGDPFSHFAAIDGYGDGELWWELNFEQRIHNQDIFEAVKEAVVSLREALPEKTSDRDKIREAFMRKGIRTAEKENYSTIAVVCGAWHVPALIKMPSLKEDQELLKGLSKEKIEVTWIPWTFNRLTYRSGYGAGLNSPGWYHHLWKFPHDDGTRWMSRVAKLLRKKNMDTSVAHIIEAVRLANSLAALRNFPRPGLDELTEAMISVLGFGDDMLLKLIHEELIISDKIGSVPDLVPKVPLYLDIERAQKSYRLPPSEGVKELKLDLREGNDLAKSTFLHRLLLLDIRWGNLTSSRSKGTFKEIWQLHWEPEFAIQIIEKGIWGNTLEEAATHYLTHLVQKTASASQLVNLLEKSVPSDLPASIDAMLVKLENLATATSDITELMKSVPGLANVVRYGNVRNSDLSVLKRMLDSMVARICIGMHVSCINIDIESAQEMLDLIIQTDQAISLIDDQEQLHDWQDSLLKLQGSDQTSPLIAGYATRLLTDRKVIDYLTAEKQLSYYMAVTNAPMEAAYWFEGFLRSSGTILLLDEQLWALMNNWVASVPEDQFTELLPVLRRTFAEFTQTERRKIGEKAKGNTAGKITSVQLKDGFDEESAVKIIPTLEMLLGL